MTVKKKFTNKKTIVATGTVVLVALVSFGLISEETKQAIETCAVNIGDTLQSTAPTIDKVE